MGEFENRHRLVVLGSGRVGKTSIIKRFMKHSYTEKYKETVEDLYCKEYDINGARIKVDILDTAGNFAFPAMRRLSISTAHAFLLVYAYNDHASFEEVKTLWEQIKEQRHNFQDIPICITGSKNDIPENERQVGEEEVQEWVDREALLNYHVSVSAKEDIGILDIFQKLIDQAKIPEAQHLDFMLKQRRASANVELEKEAVPPKDTSQSPSLLAPPSTGEKGKGRRRSVFNLPTFSPSNNDEEQTEISDKFTRSRSLVRRGSKPKNKQSKDPRKNDCVIC
ncbi:GTP-binding protein Rhes [Lingula anatina]|uniref:GTP-binding protein Rhes n=1 Tax=Lingula anatina TaxID=7574 RepID=A0A1S3HMP5_LINAN|nr:GTP-binding protein Rhes [Lingula anatina]XP_013386329.1 GTP-binding protein Rhes [Lingula anatina]XP_023930811.1 GTP-binding protein Rhes [Lingula anatina]|eukprot:XP_013386328.1 GTP-binding protein Rhes [Lingula anatina]